MILEEHNLSIDRVLELLADERRRAVLSALIKSPENVVTLDELVDTIQEDTPPPDTDRLSTELVHVHLPRLVEAGVVEYDQRSETIRYHPHAQVEKTHQFVVNELR